MDSSIVHSSKYRCTHLCDAIYSQEGQCLRRTLSAQEKANNVSDDNYYCFYRGPQYAFTTPTLPVSTKVTNANANATAPVLNVTITNTNTTTTTTATQTYALTATIPLSGLAGSYTYTTTSDCYSTGTATSLGMNNIYHQYYSFSILKGTNVFSAASYTNLAAAIATTILLISSVASYAGCYHSHLYNWMAQPQVGLATTYNGGFGNSAVAYGYAMSATAVTSCILSATTNAALTATLFKTTIFLGAQY